MHNQHVIDPGTSSFCGPSPRTPFIDNVVSLVLDVAEVTTANWVAEFDWIVTVTPHAEGAAPLKIMTGPKTQVIVWCPDHFWWTFGTGTPGDEDGSKPAWKVIEQLVTQGGEPHRAGRSSQLIDNGGLPVSGPNHNGGVRPRRKVTTWTSYQIEHAR